MEQRTATALARTFSLEGRVGIVTGQSSGLGLAISQVLADAGATIYGFNRTIRESAEHGGVTQVHLDVTDGAAVADAVAAVGAEHGLDFVISNAGITIKRPASSMSSAEWRTVNTTNVDAPFELCKLSHPYLRRSPHVGRIVTIASMAAHLGFTGVAAYCASKSAVSGLTRALAVEWAQDNVLVNSVSPGWFPTELNRQVIEQDPGRHERILSKVALRRYGDPADVAAMVWFLVSDGARYITGQDFAVDGGALAFGF